VDIRARPLAEELFDNTMIINCIKATPCRKCWTKMSDWSSMMRGFQKDISGVQNCITMDT
jgi:hypothetical protein